MEFLKETASPPDISEDDYSGQPQLHPPLSQAASTWPAILRIVVDSTLADCAWLFSIRQSGVLGDMIAQEGDVRAAAVSAIANIHGEQIPNIQHKFHWLDAGGGQCSVVIVGSASTGFAALLFWLESEASTARRRKLEEVVRQAHERMLQASGERQTNPLERMPPNIENGDLVRPLAAEPLADSFPFGIILIDEDHRIYLQNSAAEKLLMSSPEVCVSDQRLVIRQTNDAIRLQVALRSVLHGDSQQKSRKSLAINLEGAFPHIFRISHYGEVAEKPLACIMITNSALPPEIEVAPLAEPFSLTPTESRLTGELANGFSLQESAATLKCKNDTARGYLKQIFEKTGTHRQFDLISLFRNGAMPRL